MLLTIAALATLATAQYAPGIMTNPGGAIPVGIRQPNITGFMEPTVQPARGGLAICVSGRIPVTASANNLKLNVSVPANQSVVTESIVSMVSEGAMTQLAVTGMQNITGTYNISATLCMPANGTTKNSIQFLTHGVGFDRYYWDFAPGYSYADYAALKGYATFFYDRLGVGKSSKPDPITEVQAPLELAIATQLVRQLRAGAFGGRAWKVVGVGHSFGSIITQGITAATPQLLDATVLTGLTVNMTGVSVFFAGLNAAIASQNSPYRFAALNNAYLISSSAISDQIAFFKSPNFDPNMLALAEGEKGTVTIGEVLSLGSISRPATNYTAPVAIVNGLNDLPFCLGNCIVPSDKTAAARALLYPAARNVTGNQTLNVPLTGHGINLHYTATTAYQFIQNFVAAAGL